MLTDLDLEQAVEFETETSPCADPDLVIVGDDAVWGRTGVEL